ncbi:hypothetical protein [Thermogemmatispora tikiterensis]|uniref:Uncharacterized protein n=1 Tax=Thermogemmatispora tikiterensis TaxID=1825093 RepID=A0A328VDU6_9CHLR|nr:hypothetical protein [Thermogemmatispora tikiterensis]RAQ94172.1 hypothetical protein A4R35_01415 [Thermogemmatispora tikiterensis]
MAIWERQEDCESVTIVATLGTFLPLSPPGMPDPFVLSAPGRVETLLEQARLALLESFEVGCSLWPGKQSSVLWPHFGRLRTVTARATVSAV